MWSLSRRFTLAASLSLAAILALTGLVLDRAFRQAAMSAVEERLQAQVYALLAAADIDDTDELAMPLVLPDARFSTPYSGLYGEVIDAGGRVVWRSKSMLGRDIGFPVASALGAMLFDDSVDSLGDAVFTATFAVTWELADRTERRYVFRIAEAKEAYNQQVATFRQSLSRGLAAAVLLLAVVQIFLLRWGLSPLRRVADEVRAIEQGNQTEIIETYPRELQPLTDNLNALLNHEKSLLERQRRALADLAHALKTPLAVLQAAVDGDPDKVLRDTLREQAARMNQTVEYQLRRAAASGRTTLVSPLDVEPLLARLRDSLSKVYADRPVSIFINAAPNSRFIGEEGDFLEIMGNLMDNAFKWASKVVRVSTSMETGTLPGTACLSLVVEDDGPGVPESLQPAIARRGVRADSRVPGQGIGLAVVKELVEEVYDGRLLFAESPLGGTRVEVALPG